MPLRTSLMDLLNSLDQTNLILFLHPLLSIHPHFTRAGPYPTGLTNYCQDLLPERLSPLELRRPLSVAAPRAQRPAPSSAVSGTTTPSPWAMARLAALRRIRVGRRFFFFARSAETFDHQFHLRLGGKFVT